MNINENIGLGEDHKVIKEAVRTKLFIQSNLPKRDTFWKVQTVCNTQVSVLSRFNQKFCHEEIFNSVRFMINNNIKKTKMCL